MTLIKILKRTYGRVRLLVKPAFNIPIEEQKKMLYAYPDPKDDIQRSFFQYKLAMQTNGKLISLIINIASIFLIPYYLIILKKNYKRLIREELIKADGIFLSDGISFEAVPDSLKQEFPNIIIKSFTDDMCLSEKDIQFLAGIFKRYPTSFHFQLKSLMKVAIYSAQFIKHDPKAIISYTEGSFTSSIATNYCENREVQHINIMHGERYFEICVSFFRFSRYYVWDKSYVDLFKRQRAPEYQFKIELPKMLRRDLSLQKNQKYFMTYYLSDEKKESLLLIKKSFDILKSKGKICSVRLHPRGYNNVLAKKIFDAYDIEEANLISIKESFENTKYLVSLRSTVLFEGYCNGKEIILDDYSNPRAFNRLKELDYIMLNKPHLLLSEIIEG